MSIYEKIFNEQSVPYFPHNFANEIAWRIYTEACMNQEEKFDPNKYNGEAFRKFVDDETHYAIERARKNGLIICLETKETFLDIRHRVLNGLVKKAVEFFSKDKIEGNLRCDLSYIGF